MLFKIIAIAASTVVGGLALAFTINAVINKRAIQDAARAKCKEAFKAIIMQKKKKAVKVGIFDDNDNCIESDYEIKSSKGVSDNLYVGQEIYI